jgi:antirestriction protein ArdC
VKTTEINELITSRMLQALESGTVPWHQPWKSDSGGVPRSVATGKAYRGINVWLLALTSEAAGYTSPYWLTFNQARKLNGHGVRKGEHGTKVVWYKRIVKPNPDNPEEPIVFYTGGMDTVFNVCQCDDLPAMYYPDTDSSEPEILPEPQSVLDRYLNDNGPNVVRAPQGRAYYTSHDDTITLPLRSQFESAESEFCTFAHEIGHSTGYQSRCDREGIREFDHFGSGLYGREELVAEMTAAMLCALTGVPGQFDQSAAYIGSWMRAIKGDTTLVVKAARQAQSAVDMIMGDQDSDQDSSERALVAA